MAQIGASIGLGGNGGGGGGAADELAAVVSIASPSTSIAGLLDFYGAAGGYIECLAALMEVDGDLGVYGTIYYYGNIEKGNNAARIRGAVGTAALPSIACGTPGFFSVANQMKYSEGAADLGYVLAKAFGSATAGSVLIVGADYMAAVDEFLIYNTGTQKLSINGSNAAVLGLAQTFTKSQNVASVALTDGANIATDSSLANVFTVTLAGNRTLDNPTNLVAGGTYMWIVTQDGTGSRTLAYGNKFKWPGGVAAVLSTAAGAVDTITAVYNGTNLLANIQKAYA